MGCQWIVGGLALCWGEVSRLLPPKEHVELQRVPLVRAARMGSPFCDVGAVTLVVFDFLFVAGTQVQDEIARAYASVDADP